MVDFRQVQQTFTQHMRDPISNPAPDGIEDRRLAIYRRLLFGNISGFMENSFPVLYKIHSPEQWEALIRDYFIHHQAHTPYFPKMPKEFVEYLQTERTSKDDYPFLAELAHYEWMGMALKFDSREIDTTNIEPDGAFEHGILKANPVMALLSYQFPVQNISPSYKPEAIPEQPTYLVVYRDEEDVVGYMELNPVSARLLDLIVNNTHKTGLDLLQQIAEELQHPNPEVVIQGGRQTLEQMLEKGILLGTMG